jgi:PAS domain S-box-containing protein
VIARSGEEALARAQADDFAVILMDITLPGIDGLEAAATLRRDERTRRMPIIFLTAVDRDPAQMLRGYALGAADYLIKPFDAEILRSKVAVFVDLHLMREQVRELGNARALRAVAEAERTYLRTFIDSIPTLAWSARADGWGDYYNQGWYDYTGATPEQMEGWGWQSVHDPAVLPEVLRRWQRSVEAGTPFEMSFPLRRADGCFRWHLTRVTPVRDAAGAVIRWFGTNTDVDDMRRAEEREARAHQDVASALARETAARDEAEQAVRLNELFVGIVGHDLRNPMSAISMAASLLLRTLSDEKEKHVARRIVESAGRMSRMVDQLLDFTRIRTGVGLSLNRAPTDLHELCRRVVDELELVHPESPIALIVEGDDATGEWDADRLHQAVSNLVGNAIQHGAPEAPIGVRVECQPERVSIAVRNGGVIPPDLLPVMFEPFRGSERADRKGLGLGLHITQQIVLAHGGAIRVASSEADGTVFCVDLPR